MKDKKIGIVGLGRMGANMARCLHDKGYTLAALYDIQPDTAKKLADELNSHAASSLKEVTKQSDIILTVVTNDQAMETIFFPADGLFNNAAGKTFINCATLSPAMHRRIETESIKLGASCLEAAMASSIPQARNGELFLMIGGKKETFDTNKPLLQDLSKALHYVGEAGKAAEVKALVNMVMNINTAGLAEGLGLGQALGLDLEILSKIFSQTGANSRVLETDGPDMIARDHDCFFSAEHAAKDSGIALQLAQQCNINTPLAAATLAQFQRLIAAGKGTLDKSAIAELTFPGRN
ncbi:MAG: NAD(P)-dependent oxidoreductase [Chthoniobacterales bacterium]